MQSNVVEGTLKLKCSSTQALSMHTTPRLLTSRNDDDGLKSSVIAFIADELPFWPMEDLTANTILPGLVQILSASLLA
jgi:hypothetical protein